MNKVRTKKQNNHTKEETATTLGFLIQETETKSSFSVCWHSIVVLSAYILTRIVLNSSMTKKYQQAAYHHRVYNHYLLPKRQYVIRSKRR